MTALRPEDWMRVTPLGPWCEPGGFYVDPLRPVERAVITHGHSDYARGGHGDVLATPETLAIMALRLREDESTGRRQPLPYGEAVTGGEVAGRLVPSTEGPRLN